MATSQPTDQPSTGAAWPVFRGLQGFSPRDFGPDMIAGLTLAAIAVPEQMATARLGGLPPQIGLIVFVIATLGFALMGSSRLVSVGADSTIAPIFAGSLAAMTAAGSAQYGELAGALALITGLILAFAGVFRLGWIADLLSRPVMTGFLAGISLHIVLSQAPAALGLPEESGDVYHRLGALAAAIGGVNLGAAAIAAAVFAVTLGAEKLNARIPGALIGVVGATVVTACLSLDRRGVAVLGALPGGFPHPLLPELAFERLIPLVGLGLVVSLVAMVQTAATARSFGGGSADPDIDRDYMGVGFACALAGLFGGFPVNASPPRTAATAETGGRSQLSGLTAALAVFLLAAFGTGLLARTPAAALAGVLLFVAQRIFHVNDFAAILRRSPTEFALAALTATLIIALPIQTGVAIGIFLSLAHGVYSISLTRLIPFERVSGTTVWWPKAEAGPGEGQGDPTALVMGFQAPLSFLNAFAFRRDVTRTLAGRPASVRLFVLEASSIVEVDYTASTILCEVIDQARAQGVDFAVARLESVRAQTAFDRLGITERLGRDHLFHSVQQAIKTLAKASQRSEN